MECHERVDTGTTPCSEKLSEPLCLRGYSSVRFCLTYLRVQENTKRAIQTVTFKIPKRATRKAHRTPCKINLSYTVHTKAQLSDTMK